MQKETNLLQHDSSPTSKKRPEGVFAESDCCTTFISMKVVFIIIQHSYLYCSKRFFLLLHFIYRPPPHQNHQPAPAFGSIHHNFSNQFHSAHKSFSRRVPIKGMGVIDQLGYKSSFHSIELHRLTLIPPFPFSSPRIRLAVQMHVS